MNAADYNFTYENAENFQTFPTIAVVLQGRGEVSIINVDGIPKFNPMMLLHGEEKVEMYSPIEVDTTLVVEETIVDL